MKKWRWLKIIPILAVIAVVITFALLLNMKSKINEKAMKELNEKEQYENNVVESN